MNTMPWTSLLWFAVIIVIIPLALWLLKRTPLGGAASGSTMRSIGALPLSTSQRILTIEVGQGDQRRWLVLGVTPHNITTLYTMAPAAEATVPYPSAGGVAISFAQVLGRLRSPAAGADHAP